MLQVECPHHHYPAELLNQFFYDGLTQQGQCLVDSVTGGTVGSKTAAEICELYEMLGANFQQKSTRNIRRVGAAEANVTQDLAVKVGNLTKTMQRLAEKTEAFYDGGRVKKVMSCNVCGDSGHEDGVCAQGEDQQVNWMGSYEQKNNNPYSNHYNPGWRNHPNFSWKNNQAAQQPPQQYQPTPAPKPQYLQHQL